MPKAEAVVHATLAQLFDLVCAARPPQVRSAAVEVTCGRVMERVKVVLASQLALLVKADETKPPAVKSMTARRKVEAAATAHTRDALDSPYAQWRATRPAGALRTGDFAALLDAFVSPVAAGVEAAALDDVWACARDAVDDAVDKGSASALWQWAARLGHAPDALPAGGGACGGGIVYRVVQGASVVRLADELWLGVLLARWAGAGVEEMWTQAFADATVGGDHGLLDPRCACCQSGCQSGCHHGANARGPGCCNGLARGALKC